MDPKADVLIVTATKVESRAVMQAFEQITGQRSRPVPVDSRIYHDLGEVHGARMFMALTEMGSSSLGASQQTVQKGIAALQPKAVIMVGIAFGVDEQKQAIGDILISQQLLLYDLQRVGENRIVPRGDKPHASTRLIDYLRSADLHWDDAKAKIRFGLVLSGEKLVDHCDYRKQLQQFGPEMIGGEMEGAGLYVACQDAKVDWVLVKAICDWADGKKALDKDTRQQQAAQNSAEFVAHTFQHVPLFLSNQPDSAHSIENVTVETLGYSSGLELGQLKIDLCQRLVSDWPSLADYFQIPPADRARFDKGWEPQKIWEWLDVRGKLGNLPEGLRYIGRGDLAERLPKELLNRPQ